MEGLTVSASRPIPIPTTVKHLVVNGDDGFDSQFYQILKDAVIEQLTISMQMGEVEQSVDWAVLRMILSNIPPTVTMFSMECNTKLLGEKIDLSWVPGKFEFFEFNLVEHVKKWAGYTYYSAVRYPIIGIPNTTSFFSDNPIECKR